jgi:hypothetical protein
MEHTANSRESTCGICEFGARMLSILEDHLEIRHMRKHRKFRKLSITVINVKKIVCFLSKDIIYVYKKQKSSCTECDLCLLPLMTTKLT